MRGLTVRPGTRATPRRSGSVGCAPAAARTYSADHRVSKTDQDERNLTVISPISLHARVCMDGWINR